MSRSHTLRTAEMACLTEGRLDPNCSLLHLVCTLGLSADHGYEGTPRAYVGADFSVLETGGNHNFRP